MKQSSSHQKRNNFKLLIIFCLLVVAAVGISLGYRLFTLISSSSFDGKHAYTVAFVHKTDVDYLSLQPQQKRISHLAVRGEGTVKEKHSTIGVIPDGEITLASPLDTKQDIGTYFQKAFFHAGETKTKLTSYDLFRLIIATHGVKPSALDTNDIHLPADPEGISDITQGVFEDQVVMDEGKTISIINASGVPGLGKRFEEVVVNMGGTVISLKNADKNQNQSSVNFYGEKSYTGERLSKLLKTTPLNQSQQGLSDIIVVIGKDQGER